MAHFCSLFSSSSGNCTYIGTSEGGILIDAGVSAKKISYALKIRDIDPSDIKAIFVTHEHSDHIKGIRVFASNNNVPVYATGGTLDAMAQANVLNGKFPVNQVSFGDNIVDDIVVRPFRTPHDTPESCGYTVILPDERVITVATDIGHVSSEVFAALEKSDLVLLESNHDVGMLQNGEYPYYLKRRILSDIGHLCNDDCAKTAKLLLERGVTRFYLGHLSEHNNIPALAYQSTYMTFAQTGAKDGIDFLLTVCPKENDKGIVKF